MEIDINTSFNLANLIPANFLKVSESGIESAAIIKQLKSKGYNGFLIGSHFMKQSLPEQACKEFIAELNKTNTELVNHEN